MYPKMREYPKEIVVSDVIYSVKFVRKIPGIEHEGLAGVACPSTKTIYIVLGQSASERFSTFWHEVLHAIEFETGKPIPHKTVYALEGDISSVAAQFMLLSSKIKCSCDE
jgi:hypothetical protein